MNTGVLHDIMCNTRNKYHYAVRRVKKMSNNIRARKLMDASQSGDVDLLKEMKKIKGGKKTNVNLPECVEDAMGQDEIVEKFKEVYSALYNSAESSIAMEEIKNRIKEMVGQDSIKEVEKVTGKVVRMAVQKMKAGKSDISGSFSSDALLHSPDILFDSIAEVFRSFLVHGTVSKHLLVCAFLPLLKSSLKDPASTDSYRAIASSSLILKLFDNVVLLVWGESLATDSLQFGFKPGVSTSQCSWLVQEVAGYYLRSGTPIFATLCDCTKAFDKCRFDLLFQKLLDCGVPAIVTRVLIYCYEL